MTTRVRMPAIRCEYAGYGTAGYGALLPSAIHSARQGARTRQRGLVRT